MDPLIIYSANGEEHLIMTIWSIRSLQKFKYSNIQMKKISVLVFGGLGNQLFQLALAKTLKEKWINSEVDLIDLTSYAPVKREWALDYVGEIPKKINKLDYFILKVFNDYKYIQQYIKVIG